MTDYEKFRALGALRNLWLSGLTAGSRLIFKSWSAKVVRVERTTKTMIILENGIRVSKKTGAVIGEDEKSVSQLLTAHPHFEAGTEFEVGKTLSRYEEECVNECIKDLAFFAAKQAEK